MKTIPRKTITALTLVHGQNSHIVKLLISAKRNTPTVFDLAVAAVDVQTIMDWEKVAWSICQTNEHIRRNANNYHHDWINDRSLIWYNKWRQKYSNEIFEWISSQIQNQNMPNISFSITHTITVSHEGRVFAMNAPSL